MDITGKIEEVNQSDSLLLVVFYADWSPHCEWIEPLLHEFEKPVNIVRVNIESNRKVADAYEIRNSSLALSSNVKARCCGRKLVKYFQEN